MLRVGEHFEKTDTGRQRRANEDNLFARTPVFVVADGMGGAQAGEVASRIAVQAFEPGLPAADSPEERLAEVARAANRRIHDLATGDSARAGMGTTLIAALVQEDAVSFAHVGDSRAYRLRDGELEQLTVDHSLVGELVRRGKLTEAEAEEHPQKSVITRALGVEGHVDVDTVTHPARAGDVFLLCSDGLNAMVDDVTIGGILRSAPNLPAAGRRLVDEANERGGRDNITVILFRLDDVDGAEPAPVVPVAPVADQPTTVGTAAPSSADVNAALRARERDATVLGAATIPAEAAPAAPRREPRRPRRRDREDGRRRRLRFLRPLLAVLAIVAILAVAGWMVSRTVFFVGSDSAGFVTVYRGLPYEGPFGLKLYEDYYVSGVPAADLPAARRSKLLDHQLRSRSDASDLVRKIELDQLEDQTGAGPRVKARNRELLALIPPALLVVAGFTAVFIQRQNDLSNVSLTYGAIFLGLCFGTHVFLRIALPDADPYLFPLFAALASVGLVMIYRIDDTLARQQAQWYVIGLACFAATIIFLRDYRKLERYRYLIAFGSILLLMAPRLPVVGGTVNGAFLAIDIGPIAFQPAEFAKLGIVIFLASYLRDTRQILVQGSRRFLGVTIPPLKQFGPLLVVWGLAMLMLIFIRDLGSSLMFFGAFLALLYVATNRLSFVVIGLGMFSVGAWFFASHLAYVQDRVDIWRDPFAQGVVDREGYQIAQSLFAQADGGVLGVGFGQSLLFPTGSKVAILPAPDTDLIYAVITNELGLVGACGVLLLYLLIVERGFRIAQLARDSFSTLLAAGLTAVFALQVFVIVGGVTKVIPLTGVTLPFISYGGSSIVANFVLLALLLLVSDRARRRA